MQSLKEHFHVGKKSFGLVLQWRCEVTQVLWDSVWCLKNARLIPSNCWAYYWCKRPLKPRKAPTVLASEPPLFKQDKKWDFPDNNCAATAVTDWGVGVKDLSVSLIQRGICVHSLRFMWKHTLTWIVWLLGACHAWPQAQNSQESMESVPAFHPGRFCKAKLTACPFLWMGQLQHATLHLCAFEWLL